MGDAGLQRKGQAGINADSARLKAEGAMTLNTLLVLTLDTAGGSRFISRTIEDVQQAVPGDRVRAAIFEGNARRLRGLGVD
jgi:hypothetical protein